MMELPIPIFQHNADLFGCWLREPWEGRFAVRALGRWSAYDDGHCVAWGLDEGQAIQWVACGQIPPIGEDEAVEAMGQADQLCSPRREVAA